MEKLPIKILFVDDYQIILDIACSFLENDYTVITCTNGEDAIKEVASHEFAIIFMDLNIPGINGFETTEKIRLMPEGKNIPIIGLIGCASEEEISRCLDSGMNDFLEKPFNEKSISCIINKWLNGNKGNETEVTIEDQAHSDNTATKNSTPINYRKALQEFENDEPLLNSIIDKFGCVVKKQLSELKTAAAENNTKVIKDIAHSIRGGAANLCAENLSKIAEKIEQKCINSNIEDLQLDLSEFEEEFLLFEKFVKDSLNISLPTC